MNKQKSGNYFKVLSIMALGSFLAISILRMQLKIIKKKLINHFKIKLGIQYKRNA
ncbi:hypothetical protein F6Y05_01205 (plasmid) [Bacillus megaterium]|nr:hypothetical protein [Priestia megaterium]